MANEPITQRISNDLRRQIQEGSLGPGALLPSETEVAREYNVSRQTARSALQALEHEGLVIVRPRRGRVVRSNQRLRWHLSEFERPDHTVLTTSDAWETDIEGQGHDPTRQDLQVERISPPETHRDAGSTWTRGRTSCVVRRHVRYIDGKPAIISDDYFDETHRPRAPSWPSPRTPPARTSSAEAGYEQVYDIDEIITRMPTPDEVTRLGISAGTPVAEHIRTGYTANDKPVRVMISIVPGDTLILQYTIPT